MDPNNNDTESNKCVLLYEAVKVLKLLQFLSLILIFCFFVDLWEQLEQQRRQSWETCLHEEGAKNKYDGSFSNEWKLHSLFPERVSLSQNSEQMDARTTMCKFKAISPI